MDNVFKQLFMPFFDLIAKFGDFWNWFTSPIFGDLTQEELPKIIQWILNNLHFNLDWLLGFSPIDLLSWGVIIFLITATIIKTFIK